MMGIHSHTRLKSEIYSPCKILTYPDGTSTIYAASKPIFGGAGWEPSCRWDIKIPAAGEPCEAVAGEAVGDSTQPEECPKDTTRARRRARTRLIQLCRANPDLDWFVTLTIDPTKCDSKDPVAVTRKLNNWLDNRVRRNGLKYLVVAEYHKKGGIHFHGLFNDCLPVVDSGTISLPGQKRPRKPRSERQREQWISEGGQIVYNLPAWSLGFTTAIRVYGDRNRAYNYVSKYIQKSEGKVGGRWYYSGGKLQNPDISYCDICYDDIAHLDGAYATTIPEAGFSLAIYEAASPGKGGAPNE